MTKRTPPSPKWATCTGPDGHPLPTDLIDTNGWPLGQRRQIDLAPDFPDIILCADAAPVGIPCVGVIPDITNRAGHRVPGWHARRIFARFEPPHPSAPGAVVAVRRMDDDQVHVGLAGVSEQELLSLTDISRLLAAWESLIKSGYTMRAGHPSEPDLDRETYMQAWRQVRPQYQTTGLVQALARKLGRHPNTIRNYNRKYSWPLYDDPPLYKEPD